MEGNCPQCRVRLELPHSGTYQCERCRTRFEVLLGFPRPLHPAGAFPVPGFGAPPPVGFPGPPLPPPTLPAGGEASCAGHPGSPAQFVCERCGDFMCRLCATPVEGRLYCPKCFDLLYSRGALHLAQRQFNLPGVSFGLGLGGLLVSVAGCACVTLVASFPLSVGGLWTGIRALKELGERPELPGRGLTITGVVLSSLGILASLGWVGFWVYTFSQK
jgi:hypothetical protein